MEGKEQAIMCVFLAAMIVCGCSVETMCDDIASLIIAVFALLVAIACVMVLGGAGNGSDH